MDVPEGIHSIDITGKTGNEAKELLNQLWNEISKSEALRLESEKGYYSDDIKNVDYMRIYPIKNEGRDYAATYDITDPRIETEIEYLTESEDNYNEI